MNGLTQDAATFIAAHAAWAGLILGLVTFGESIVLVGALLPATVLLFAAGGLIAIGVLDATPVFLWAVLGAVLGDAVSFILGHRLGVRSLRHPWLAKHRRAIARTRLLTRRYGTRTIFIGRFAGPVRAFIPMIAGMLRMPSLRFHIANVGSGLVWVGVSLVPGYLAARGLGALSLAILGPAATAATGAFGLAALCMAASKALRRRTAAQLAWSRLPQLG